MFNTLFFKKTDQSTVLPNAHPFDLIDDFGDLGPGFVLKRCDNEVFNTRNARPTRHDLRVKSVSSNDSKRAGL